MKKRLAIIVTHPIQYYAPVFKLLTERANIELKVFYTWGRQSIDPKFDPGFGKTIKWDIPLLDGYDHEFLENIAKRPGSSHFFGIINPHALVRINAFSPDVILVYGWSNRSHLHILRYFKGKIPVWFRGDSTLIDEQKSWKSILKGTFLRWLYTKVDKAFYVGAANKAYFEKYGLTEQQLAFAPHAIDNERFATIDNKKAIQIRRSLSIPETDTLILFGGKLAPKKNPEILLRAFSSIEKSTAHLLFVGNGELETRLREKVLNENIRNVHFMDFQNQTQMPGVYQSCDIFCLPSAGPGETWGLAINEAMAAGKAIIASDKVGCVPDLVVPGQNGYVFNSTNQDQLLMLLNEVISDKQKISTMGAKSSAIITNWSFVKQVECFEHELQGL